MTVPAVLFIVDNTCEMAFPLPDTAPVTLVCETVHSKVVPVVRLVRFAANVSLEQIGAATNGIAAGVSSISITAVSITATQPALANVE